MSREEHGARTSQNEARLTAETCDRQFREIRRETHRVDALIEASDLHVLRGEPYRAQRVAGEARRLFDELKARFETWKYLKEEAIYE